ncbi:CAP domain-containing protein [Bacillus sp. FJAT-22090]|uniref:CAP domain-containing protein n=1 Tax=Bacillus sp. FJAT-22090 TaxID=1581038 RepID=UPI0006ADD359|nr:CAP domain-containing protein [Bacillus sp. FJAT-22090]
MKKLIFLLMFLISLSIVPISTNAANCPGVVYWDGVELKTGQIGRVIIQKPTTIYKNNNGVFEASRTVKKGEVFRIYANKGSYYQLGGGLVIKNDASILYQTPSKEKFRLLNCKQTTPTSMVIGDSITSVNSKLGGAKKSIPNEFDASTSIYHKNYNNFYAISYLNNKIASLYTKDKNYQFNGISIASTVSQLESKLGKAYETTGNTYPIEIITYDFPKYEANFFIDVHNDNKISAIYLIDRQLIKRNANLYPKKSSTLEKSYETLLYEITNAERKAKGVSILQYSTDISNVARGHSVDMGKHDYFNHDNLDGESPFDRLANGGILFRNAGENIAMGYTNPYFAHEALMNSLGHRKNIVSTNYTQHGVGVFFADWTYGSIPYYTENFIKP